MHELKHEPKNLCLAQAVLPHPTYVMYIDNAVGGVTPAGRKVSEQIIQLALPYWMWVSWPA